MTTGNVSVVAPVSEHGDDYALTRVPAEARHHWFSVCIQRFGQLSCLSQFMLGAALGFGMTFTNAILAVVLGAVILEVVGVFTGIIGQREGLSTSVIARWTGFGRWGSGLIGIVIALSLTGWFGVQTAVSAESLKTIIPVGPIWLWSLLFGLAVTAIVIYGFNSMAWVAYVTVPAFILLAGYLVIAKLTEYDLHSLVSGQPAGPVLSLGAGATLVAGGFIVGMVTTPDMTRFNRSARDVVKQTLLGVTLGELVMCLAGVLLAHALRTDSVVDIVTSSSGFVGTLIIVSGTLKINDWNLYSSTLGIVNALQTSFGVVVNRRIVTIIVGIAGSVLAALGILDHFIDFLTVLGVVIPPIAGIMATEYFLVRTWRAELDRSAAGLPAQEPTLIIGTLVVWLLAAAVGYYVTWGISSLNSLVVAMVGYFLFAKVGLLKPLSIQPSRFGAAA
ncbi:cytosine permease [Mycolicibacterium cosmeticum]|uniref:Cytosine permease n=1 Tax=Mycolicibacterium cosmeticum TaxID=258533 RepID=W9ATQ6_MYCCO|nr:cytosine permease [Mycolicibacterium cosmeticum]TLH73248.1 cytosine permease [Mycolicibacterium cosmeticum]CDO08898.1 cytosine permease [Mycolicibacterium cosmeticum]